jgi:hypothetical protein
MSQYFMWSGPIVAVLVCSKNDSWECAGNVTFRVRLIALGNMILGEVKHGIPFGSGDALSAWLSICRRLSVLAKRLWWLDVTVALGSLDAVLFPSHSPSFSEASPFEMSVPKLWVLPSSIAFQRASLVSIVVSESSLA